MKAINLGRKTDGLMIIVEFVKVIFFFYPSP